MPTTRELLYPIHSSYALRASFTPPLPGHTKPKVHAFDGVRGSCGRQPETSAWVHPVLMFHPPTTYPTCRSCQSHGGYPASYPSPELLYRVIGRLLTYAEAHRDPAVLAVALRCSPWPCVCCTPRRPLSRSPLCSPRRRARDRR